MSMDNKFFKLWLPISVVVHAILVVVLVFMPPTHIPQLGHVVKVGFLPDMPGVTTPEKPKIDLPDLRDLVQQPILPSQARRADVDQPGTRDGSPDNHGISLPGRVIQGRKPGVDGPGKSPVRTPAPKTITSNSGGIESPTATANNGAGTGGKGTEIEGGGSGGGENRLAQAMTSRNAKYPKDADNEHRNGQVTLIVGVNSNGMVTSVSVASSSGGSDFVRNAEVAARRWTFSPALKNGVPVDTTHTITFTFRNGDVTYSDRG